MPSGSVSVGLKALTLVALFASCATTGLISSYRSGDLIIYSGTNYNGKTISDDHCVTATEKAIAVLDFPGSFLFDTAALPFSISLQRSPPSRKQKNPNPGSTGWAITTENG